MMRHWSGALPAKSKTRPRRASVAGRTTWREFLSDQRRAACVLRHGRVERVPLLRLRPSERISPPSLGRKFLAVLGAGRTRDALVHQGAAEVGARLEASRRAGRPHLHPGGLDVRDLRMERAAARPRASSPLPGTLARDEPALPYIGASICTKGNRTNSVKPPVSTCRSRRAMRCRDQDKGGLDMAVHDRRGRAQAEALCGLRLRAIAPC